MRLSAPIGWPGDRPLPSAILCGRSVARTMIGIDLIAPERRDNTALKDAYDRARTPDKRALR
jgi:hypothetical protein